MIRDRSRSVLHSRVVFFTLQPTDNRPLGGRLRPPPCSRYRTATAATTNRLPMLPCASRVLVGEAEIYKTVEFVTKKSPSESIVPDQLPCDEHVPKNRCPECRRPPSRSGSNPSRSGVSRPGNCDNAFASDQEAFT
jgi:hypothetical protein